MPIMMQLHFNKPISSTDQTFVLNSFISIFSQYVLMLLNSIPIIESHRAWSMSVIPIFAILAILRVPFRVFCHFVHAHLFEEGFSARMAISEKASFLLLPVINEL